MRRVRRLRRDIGVKTPLPLVGRGRARLRRDAGFSMLEMLAMLAILALVIGSSTILARPPSPSLRLQSAARQLCAALRMTRARAVATNMEMAVTFDSDSKTYASPVVAQAMLPQDAAVQFTVSNAQRHGATQGSVAFFPGGGSSGADITLTLGGRRAEIGVNWLTGATRCDLV